MSAHAALTAYDTEDARPATQAAAVRKTVSVIVDGLDQNDVAWSFLRHPDEVLFSSRQSGDATLVLFANTSRSYLIDIITPLGPIQASELDPGYLTVIVPVDAIFLRIDICYRDPQWRGAPIASIEEITRQGEDIGDIRVASPFHKAWLSWLLPVVRNTHVRLDDILLAEEALHEFPDASREFLGRLFGQHMSQRAIAAVKAERVSEGDLLARDLRRTLWTRAIKRQPIRTIGGWLSGTRQRVNRWRHPAGLEVAILGADGVGKTSLCAAIANRPQVHVPFQRTTWTHLYDRVLPPLGEIARRVKRQPPSPDGRHGTSSVRTPAHPVFWALGYGYYTVDMWLSHVLKGRRNLRRMELVLHDRHSLDVSLDLTRYRFKGPKGFALWLVGLAPQPDLIIMVDAPDKVVIERKPNTPPEETRRRLEVYRDYVRRHPETPVIDGSQTPDAVLQQALALISDLAASRTRARLGLASADGRMK